MRGDSGGRHDLKVRADLTAHWIFTFTDAILGIAQSSVRYSTILILSRGERYRVHFSRCARATHIRSLPTNVQTSVALALTRDSCQLICRCYSLETPLPTRTCCAF